MWIVSFVPCPGIQRLREQDPGQILWNRLHKTESDRRQQAQGRHSGGGRKNRAVQTRVSVYLCMGDPWQTSVGGDLHQRQHTQRKCTATNVHDLICHVKWLFFLMQWRKRRWATIRSVLLNAVRLRAHPNIQKQQCADHLCAFQEHPPVHINFHYDTLIWCAS